MRYILIKESDLDSRIEELKENINHNSTARELSMIESEVLCIQSLKQKGEVVEITEIKQFIEEKQVKGMNVTPFKFLLERQNYKLIKKV